MCVFYDVFSHFKENKRPRSLLIQGGLTSKIQKTWFILQSNESTSFSQFKLFRHFGLNSYSILELGGDFASWSGFFFKK